MSWIQKNDERFRPYWERTDGCYVWWNEHSPYPNPMNPNSRLWVACFPERKGEIGCDYLCQAPRRKKRGGESPFLIPRRFKTAEAAMKALDKEFPEKVVSKSEQND